MQLDSKASSYPLRQSFAPVARPMSSARLWSDNSKRGKATELLASI